MFVDPDNNDMHLLYNDDAKTDIIDQGYPFLTHLSSKMDKDLTSRELVPEIGAFEYQNHS